MNRSIGSRYAVACALAAAVMAGTAIAAPGPDALRDAPSVTVKYGDLDLSREEGVRVLYGRLRTAAKRVCADGGIGDIARHAEVNRCIDTALSRAVAGVGNDRLAALHQTTDRRARAVVPRIAAVAPER